MNSKQAGVQADELHEGQDGWEQRVRIVLLRYWYNDYLRLENPTTVITDEKK